MHDNKHIPQELRLQHYLEHLTKSHAKHDFPSGAIIAPLSMGWLQPILEKKGFVVKHCMTGSTSTSVMSLTVSGYLGESA